MLNQMPNGKTQMLIESWKKRITALESSTKKSSQDRRVTLAHVLETTNQMAKYHESIQTPDAGMYKIHALDIVGAVVQNLIAPEIVSINCVA